jgi:hypothetical protein
MEADPSNAVAPASDSRIEYAKFVAPETNQKMTALWKMGTAGTYPFGSYQFHFQLPSIAAMFLVEEDDFHPMYKASPVVGTALRLSSWLE